MVSVREREREQRERESESRERARVIPGRFRSHKYPILQAQSGFAAHKTWRHLHEQQSNQTICCREIWQERLASTRPTLSLDRSQISATLEGARKEGALRTPSMFCGTAYTEPRPPVPVEIVRLVRALSAALGSTRIRLAKVVNATCHEEGERERERERERGWKLNEASRRSV